VLQHVVDEGPVTATYLATVQHVSPQSIAQNLAVLKAAGLVQAERDPRLQLGGRAMAPHPTSPPKAPQPRRRSMSAYCFAYRARYR
jgi:hypothetical protein